MATITESIQSDFHPSSRNSSKAHQLGSDDRVKLAVEVLSKKVSISDQADQYEVSRKFVSQQRDKAKEALQDVFTPKSRDEDVLFYLPVTKRWLKQVVLCLILSCHSSYRGVIEFFRDILDLPLSVGSVHNIVDGVIPKAQQVTQSYDLSPIQVGSHDELFQSGKPVLAGLDLDSTYCYLLTEEDHRDATTWAIHLMDLEVQGLSPENTVADGGLGLRAGQAIAWPNTPCFGDVFHGLQEMTKVVTRLEKRAYKAMTHLNEVEKKMLKAKLKNKGRSFSTKLVQARLQEKQTLGDYDTMYILTQWMREDILSFAGPDYPTRCQLYDWVIEEIRKIETGTPDWVASLRRSLENQKQVLLAFAHRIDQSLQQIADEFKVETDWVRQLLHLRQMPYSCREYGDLKTELHKRFGHQFYEIQEALTNQMNHIHRASSLVENLNSRLRNYFFLRRNIGNRYLELLQFFLNHHPFLRSKHPHRVGKTPAELMTGKKHPHWLELLGFTRFRRFETIG